MKKLFYALVLSGLLFSCTDNESARKFGGTSQLRLPRNKRLVSVTWKETSMWYLTEDMPDGYKPQVKEFKEESAFGIMEGSVMIIESRDPITIDEKPSTTSSPWNTNPAMTQ